MNCTCIFRYCIFQPGQICEFYFHFPLVAFSEGCNNVNDYLHFTSLVSSEGCNYANFTCIFQLVQFQKAVLEFVHYLHFHASRNSSNYGCHWNTQLLVYAAQKLLNIITQWTHESETYCRSGFSQACLSSTAGENNASNNKIWHTIKWQSHCRAKSTYPLDRLGALTMIPLYTLQYMTNGYTAKRWHCALLFQRTIPWKHSNSTRMCCKTLNSHTLKQLLRHNVNTIANKCHNYIKQAC